MDNILIRFVVGAKLRIIVHALGNRIKIWKISHWLVQ